MYLGIEQHTGLIYEGTGNPDIPVVPMPSVVHAKFIEQPADWKSLPRPSETFGLVFREDSFDAVSRTRRGRLYQKKEGAQPEQHTVSAHPYRHHGRTVSSGFHRGSDWLHLDSHRNRCTRPVKSRRLPASRCKTSATCGWAHSVQPGFQSGLSA